MPTRINARLDEALAQKLDAYERRTGASTTEVLREALGRYLADAPTESPYDALSRAGVVGSVTAPSGLSSRYKAELRRSLRKKHGL